MRQQEVTKLSERTMRVQSELEGYPAGEDQGDLDRRLDRVLDRHLPSPGPPSGQPPGSPPGPPPGLPPGLQPGPPPGQQQEVGLAVVEPSANELAAVQHSEVQRAQERRHEVERRFILGRKDTELDRGMPVLTKLSLGEGRHTT